MQVRLIEDTAVRGKEFKKGAVLNVRGAEGRGLIKEGKAVLSSDPPVKETHEIIEPEKEKPVKKHKPKAAKKD